MKIDIDPIMSDLAAFLKATQMAETTLATRALNDRGLFIRLRAGRMLTRKTRRKLRVFMRHHLAEEMRRAAGIERLLRQFEEREAAE